MKKRVVITGMEIVSSLGNNLEDFWGAAIEGCCGIERIQSYDPTPYTTQIGGEIKGFDLQDLPETMHHKRYPRVAQYALSCTYKAVQRSGLTANELIQAGTFIGTSLGGMPEQEAAYRSFFNASWRKIPALSVIRGMPNSVANHIGIALKLGGPHLTFSNACLSSADAIGYAYQQISQGKLSIAVCGGTESLLWESMMAAWCRLRVMSTCNTTPKSACKPFSKNRDGMVMADGAAMLILEDYQHAKARGATILAEIIGIGSSCDASHVTAPNSDGQQRAIRAALDDARLAAGDVQYINAHGTGTVLNDFTETATIKAVFGSDAYQIPITAQKS